MFHLADELRVLFERDDVETKLRFVSDLMIVCEDLNLEPESIVKLTNIFNKNFNCFQSNSSGQFVCFRCSHSPVGQYA